MFLSILKISAHPASSGVTSSLAWRGGGGGGYEGSIISAACANDISDPPLTHLTSQ